MVYQRRVVREQTQFYVPCPHCGKEITGTNEGQVEYNLKIHIDAKHPEVSR